MNTLKNIRVFQNNSTVKVRLLIVGCGGREVSIIKALKRSKNCPDIYVVGEYLNPGLTDYKKYLTIENILDVDLIIDFASKNEINIAVIGPEGPLEVGLADQFWNIGIPCIGPTLENAMIETSKGFTRNLMEGYDLAKYSPIYELITDENIKLELFEKLLQDFEGNYVIKADGLRGGKGVKLSGSDLKDTNEAYQYCLQLLEEDHGFLIEEKLVGQEFSLMSFCDGKTLAHMPVVQDYKRAYDNDLGPNTGGMGCVMLANGTLPFLTESDVKLAQSINQRVMEALATEKDGVKEVQHEYIGVLYGSFMKTDDGEIKVIEYNSRFGDPEAINILHVLKTDLMEIFKSMITRTLEKLGPLEFAKEYCVSRYICPKGYPNNSIRSIIDLSQVENSDSLILSSVYYHDFYLETHGSRAIAVVESGPDLEKVLISLDKTLAQIKGEVYYRTDIGKRYLKAKVEIKREINDFDLNLDKDDLNDLDDLDDLNTAEITYEKAGVSISEGNQAVESIKDYVKSTHNSSVTSGYGNFTGGYSVPYNNDTGGSCELVASMDGVGTKVQTVLHLMPRAEAFESLGHDLFNNNLNDLLCAGPDVEPLFFLDYFGCRKLKHQDLSAFVKGLSSSCNQVGCVLLGGETAELPQFYNKLKNPVNRLEPVEDEESFEMVGTIVGRHTSGRRYDSSRVKLNDCVLAFKSSGPHTNGYSLINYLMTQGHQFDEQSIKDICVPHRGYYHLLKIINQLADIKVICHITGGGLIDNPPRVLPDSMKIQFNPNSDWKIPQIFKTIKSYGALSDFEMKRTFNCGLGMLLICDQTNAQIVKDVMINIFRDSDTLLDVGFVMAKDN